MNKIILTLSYESMEKILNLPKGMKIVAAQDSIDSNCIKLRVICEDGILNDNQQMNFNEETREWNKTDIKNHIDGQIDFYKNLLNK